MENLNCFVILAVVISLKVMRKDFQTSWGRQKIEKTKIVEKKKKKPQVTSVWCKVWNVNSNVT